MMQTNPKPVKVETVHLDDNVKVWVPYYSVDQLPKGFCARYARLCAGVIFGEDFPVADAWQMREQRDVFLIKADTDRFVHLVERGIVKPGTLLGVYCPGSTHNGDDREYTHMALYLGKENGKPVVLEQISHEIRIVPIQDYQKDKLAIRDEFAQEMNKSTRVENILRTVERF